MLKQRARRILSAADQFANAESLHLLMGSDFARSRVNDVFARVVEASRRAHRQTHFPVQIAGGLALARNRIVEMQTGEGKTLTAILPIALRALARKGCHVLTANDYLAERDAEFARPILEQLGITVGCIQARMDDYQRRDAYLYRVTVGDFSPTVPTDPYVPVLEHTVPQIMDSLRDEVASALSVREQVGSVEE